MHERGGIPTYFSLINTNKSTINNQQQQKLTQSLVNGIQTLCFFSSYISEAKHINKSCLTNFLN